MSKTLIVNGRFLTQPLSGIQRYGLEILTALDELFHSGRLDSYGWEICVVAPRSTLHDPGWKVLRVRRVGPGSGHFWEQAVLPAYVGRKPFVTLSILGPRLIRSTVAAIHDLSFIVAPQAYSMVSRFMYKELVLAQANYAKAIVTGSHHSKSELVRVLGIDPDRITVVPHSVEHIRRVPPDRGALHRLGVKQPYVLAVGTMHLNKNLGVLSRAVLRLGSVDFEVVVAGGSNANVFSAGKPGTLQNLRFLGRVADADLRVLYENALCLVFPSLYEGFGLPPLEAMACGCPVICSNATSLPEVCGQAATYFDPADEIGLASAMGSVINDAELRASLKARGLEQASRYSWHESASRTWGVISRHLPG